MKFLNNLNIIQKIFLFILFINFFIGIPIYNLLGLTNIGWDGYGFWEVNYWRHSSFWWGLNIILPIGIYLFKDSEE